MARIGSGSACRSIPDGFVEWLDGDTESSYGISIFPPDYWDISLVAVVVGSKQKDISSTEGQRLVNFNPFYLTRLARMKDKIKRLKEFIREKNFQAFGELIEQEALELHAMALTSTPPIIYWQPETIKIIKLVKEWRMQNFFVYFTIDAGPHPYLICKGNDQKKLLDKLKKIKEINKIIVNKPTVGTRLANAHLF